MSTAEYVTQAELHASLKDLDKKQRGRLYTVRGQLLLHMDEQFEDLETNLRGEMGQMKVEILAELRNGHK